ncbi:MAG: TetR/AcrR family transcriptional regulator [Umezawaea sp.]
MTDVPTTSRIASAALRILVEEGSAAVTMRRVATAVGVTPMAIYKHYPSRQALLTTVADEAFREIGSTWEKHAPDGDLKVRIQGMLTNFLDFALGKPNLYAFLLTDRREHARRFPDDFTDGRSPTFSPIFDVVQQCMRDGILRVDDPVEVTLALTASTQGLVQLYLGGRIGLPEAEFRELCLRTVWRIFDGIKI